MSASPPAAAYRLTRFCLISADAAALATFYGKAFGCCLIAQERLDGAARITLALGRARIEIVQYDQPGPAYPKGASASDLLFQHFAIVVRDMAKAVERLSTVTGWTAITRGGPQILPQSSGGVTAFKFRDPEGHPLEFLAFPPGQMPQKWRNVDGDPCLGIDHSAIGVADATVSRAYYESLGLHICAHSLNRGPEQERLDNVAGAVVDVTALSPSDDGPHIELLCYRGATHPKPVALESNAIAATRLIFETGTAAPGTRAIRRSTFDPDAHHLTIIEYDGA
jgi:catechol 2,3-dioxygenase-like lactoylglutathione lyase family enzyme